MSFQQAAACWTGRHDWFEPSTQGMHAAHRRPSEPMVRVDVSLSIMWELRACQRSVPPRSVRQQTIQIGCFGIRSSAPHDSYIGAPMAPSGAFRLFLITPARTRTNAHTPTHKHTCTCRHMHMLQMFHTRKHTHTHAPTHTHSHTQTHTHTHTHTHTQWHTEKGPRKLPRRSRRRRLQGSNLRGAASSQPGVSMLTLTSDGSTATVVMCDDDGDGGGGILYAPYAWCAPCRPPRKPVKTACVCSKFAANCCLMLSRNSSNISPKFAVTASAIRCSSFVRWLAMLFPAVVRNRHN